MALVLNRSLQFSCREQIRCREARQVRMKATARDGVRTNGKEFRSQRQDYL